MNTYTKHNKGLIELSADKITQNLRYLRDGCCHHRSKAKAVLTKFQYHRNTQRRIHQQCHIKITIFAALIECCTPCLLIFLIAFTEKSKKSKKKKKTEKKCVSSIDRDHDCV